MAAKRGTGGRAGNLLPPPLERTILFFRVYAVERQGRIARIDPADVVAEIRRANPQLLPIGRDESLVPELAPGATDRFSLRLVSWRGHYQTSPTGTHERLRLPNGAGISYPTHFRFFRDNVLAVEINRKGPAPTAIVDYLQGRGDPELSRLRMRRIADRGQIEKINQMRTLSRVHIRIPEASIGFLQRSGNAYIHSLAPAARALEDGGVFEVGWSTFRGNGRLNADALKALALNLIEVGDDLGGAAQIVLVGVGPRGAEIEYTLARDYVNVRRPMARDADGYIEARVAYDALEVAYNEARSRFSPQLFLRER